MIHIRIAFTIQRVSATALSVILDHAASTLNAGSKNILAPGIKKYQYHDGTPQVIRYQVLFCGVKTLKLTFIRQFDCWNAVAIFSQDVKSSSWPCIPHEIIPFIKFINDVIVDDPAWIGRGLTLEEAYKNVIKKGN